MFGIYFDDDSSHHAVVSGARRSGFRCLTAQEANRRRHSDPEQLAFATESGLVVFTCNVRDHTHFEREWAQAGRVHSGIIALSDQRTPIGVQLRALQNLAAGVSAEEMRGRIEFLLRWA